MWKKNNTIIIVECSETMLTNHMTKPCKLRASLPQTREQRLLIDRVYPQDYAPQCPRISQSRRHQQSPYPFSYLVNSMSQIPLATEFENVIRVYYNIGINVVEPPVFLGLAAALIGFLCIPKVFGKRTVSTRRFIGKLVAFLICAVATLFLLLASSKIPVMKFKKSGFYRYDCLASSKGGKKNEGYGRYRDCDFSSGPTCTKEEPCTPCNLDPDLDQHVQQRVKNELACRSCGADASLEKCNFVEGKGPYCIFKGRRHPIASYLPSLL